MRKVDKLEKVNEESFKRVVGVKGQHMKRERKGIK